MPNIIQIQIGTTTYTIADEIANNNINSITTSLYSLTTSLGTMATVNDASSDDKTYGRKNGNWVEVTGESGSTDWSDITNKPSIFSPSPHVHGNLDDAGKVTNDVNVGNGDHLLIADHSAGDKLYMSNVTFDGSTRTKALTPKGTFESFAAATHDHDGAYCTLMDIKAEIENPSTLSVSYGTSVTSIISGSSSHIYACKIGSIVFVGGYFATTKAWTSTLTNAFTGLPAANTDARFVASVGSGKTTVIYYSSTNGWCISQSQSEKGLNFAFTYITT